MDTLLLSVGLLPENTLSEEAGIELHPRTHGRRWMNIYRPPFPAYLPAAMFSTFMIWWISSRPKGKKPVKPPPVF